MDKNPLEQKIEEAVEGALVDFTNIDTEDDLRGMLQEALHSISLATAEYMMNESSWNKNDIGVSEIEENEYYIRVSDLQTKYKALKDN